MTLNTRNAHRDLAWISAFGLILSAAFVANELGRQGRPPPLQAADPIWLFCCALFVANVAFLIPSGGRRGSRFMMAGFLGVWIVVSSLPITVPYLRDSGRFDKVRLQQPDGTWRESWQVLSYPHMPH
jgi:hypothetical protein